VVRCCGGHVVGFSFRIAVRRARVADWRAVRYSVLERVAWFWFWRLGVMGWHALRPGGG
jgi:hypothetical protein